MTDIVERLLNWLNQSQQEQHETAIEAADKILRLHDENERLREENERLRSNVKFVRNHIDEYVASRFDPGMMAPTLDRIRWHFCDQDNTANTTANTADATTDENYAKP